MRIGNTLPNPIPGAGRLIDFTYPSLGQYINGTVASMRNNISAQTQGCTQQGILGGGGNGVQASNGVPTVYLQSSAAVGNGNAVYMNPARILLTTTKGNFIDPSCNDYAVWRLIFNVGLFAPPAATGEVGCYVTCDPNQAKIVTGGASGFGFRFLNDGSIVYLVSVGGVPTNTTVFAGPLVSEQIHSLELRMFGATQTQEARLQVLVDGALKVIPATSCTWGAGTLLPGVGATTIASATIGFLPCLVNVANIVNALRIASVRVIAGPTLDSCL
jgi:hypothetical protein